MPARVWQEMESNKNVFVAILTSCSKESLQQPISNDQFPFNNVIINNVTHYSFFMYMIILQLYIIAANYMERFLDTQLLVKLFNRATFFKIRGRLFHDILPQNKKSLAHISLTILNKYQVRFLIRVVSFSSHRLHFFYKQSKF